MIWRKPGERRALHLFVGSWGWSCAAMRRWFTSLWILRVAVVTTLACSLLLQAGYFGRVLFLIWQSSSRARGTRHRGQHADGYRKARVPVV
ncbi:exopolysaccharide production repressor protein [Mesorhizobium sp.]|uniref:exopolysaccharide production repressor protein n=2 Tax=Mesorhizobium sp. TaxID=1871066 RepID=UPI003428D7CA